MLFRSGIVQNWCPPDIVFGCGCGKCFFGKLPDITWSLVLGKKSRKCLWHIRYFWRKYRIIIGWAWIRNGLFFSSKIPEELCVCAGAQVGEGGQKLWKTKCPTDINFWMLRSASCFYYCTCSPTQRSACSRLLDIFPLTFDGFQYISPTKTTLAVNWAAREQRRQAQVELLSSSNVLFLRTWYVVDHNVYSMCHKVDST